jgi:hypothetical protein
VRRCLALTLASACACSQTIDVPRGSGAANGWRNAYRSPKFADGQGRTAPHTELRATADDTNLYLLIYVADVDLESNGDKVELDVGPLHLVATPTGGTVPPGVKLNNETEGTIDKPNDLDEEWVSELSIPWSLLGSHEVRIHAERTDVGHGEPPHRLSWPPRRSVLRFADRPRRD